MNFPLTFNVNRLPHNSCIILHIIILFHITTAYINSQTHFIASKEISCNLTLCNSIFTLIALQNRKKYLQYILGILVSC